MPGEVHFFGKRNEGKDGSEGKTNRISFRKIRYNINFCRAGLAVTAVSTFSLSKGMAGSLKSGMRGKMDQKGKRIEFHFGKFGKLAPLLVAAAMIMWAALSQSNVNGYVLAFFAALVAGVLFARDEKAWQGLQ